MFFKGHNVQEISKKKRLNNKDTKNPLSNHAVLIN